MFSCLQDAEGVLIANIGSYMGGVDLWQNENESNDNFDPQSMHDKMLEVVSISGTWHLGKLQVTCSFVFSSTLTSLLSSLCQPLQLEVAIATQLFGYHRF